jgi:hypothetical protein
MGNYGHSELAPKVINYLWIVGLTVLV